MLLLIFELLLLLFHPAVNLIYAESSSTTCAVRSKHSHYFCCNCIASLFILLIPFGFCNNHSFKCKKVEITSFSIFLIWRFSQYWQCFNKILSILCFQKSVVITNHQTWAAFSYKKIKIFYECNLLRMFWMSSSILLNKPMCFALDIAQANNTKYDFPYFLSTILRSKRHSKSTPVTDSFADDVWKLWNWAVPYFMSYFVWNLSQKNAMMCHCLHQFSQFFY